MPVVSIVFGLLLSGLGAYFYLNAAPEYRSFTALIPAFFGVPLILCGLVALKESMLKHAMHAAAVIGLVGFIGGVANLVRAAVGGAILSMDNPKVQASAGMAVLCLIFVGLCVNSFIQARRRRAAQSQA